MSSAIGDYLTIQFYDFELRGRGWYVAPFPIELEPHFHPFFGYQTPRSYIDDGRKETILSSIAALFKPDPIVPVIQAYESPPFQWFPYDDTNALSGYTLSFPKHTKPATDLMEQCLIMLSGMTEPLSFEIVATHATITIQLVFRVPYGAHIYSQLKAYFPDVLILPLQDTDTLIDPDLPLYTTDFALQEECVRPIATGHNNIEPYTSFFGILDELQPDERIVFQVLFSGTINAWAESFERVVSDGHNGSFFFDAPEMPHLTKEKTSNPLFAVAVRVLTQATVLDTAYALLERAAFAITKASTSPHNALIPLPSTDYSLEQRIDDITLRQTHRVGMLLNSKELCTLVHLPSSQLSKKLHGHSSTTKAAPSALHHHPYVLGINSHHGVDVSVGIDDAQRSRHIHLLGVSGSGKTTLLHNLIMSDVVQGKGLCCIDPHGDLIEAMLANIPEHRVKDVVLIDPSDHQYPIAFNILSTHSELEKELLASDLVALFRRFSTSWGDQMNSVFANAISAFVYNRKVGHLGDLRKFLIETEFRNSYLATCTDPDIVYYWQREYPILKSSSIGSILTRLDSFLRPKVIRHMVCQEHGLNFQELMDTNKIILVKLSHGLIGEENSYLLGAFIVSKLQQTAMARQSQQAHDRTLFTCYIDEMQHFVTPSMNSMLSGGRKYALSLVLAHQELAQLTKTDSDIASAVLANAGTRICFKLSDTDSKRMQEGFSAFSQEDLQNLAMGEAIVRVNTKEQDFNIAVIPNEKIDTSHKDAIVAYSRQAYSVPLEAQHQSEPSHPAPEQQPVSKPNIPHPPKPPVPMETIPEVPIAKEMREHRYLQTQIKKTAESHGYKANVEVPTKDGKGLIDVLLEKGGQKIAIEISVTTPTTWELHNIRKCLANGFQNIVVCTLQKSKIALIKKRIQSDLTIEEQCCVQVMTPEEITTLFVQTEPQETTTLYKGYTVKVQYDQSAGGSRNEIIQRIMQSGKK